MERHLCHKTAPRRQGVRPPGVTHHVGRPYAKKEAAKKSLDRKKTLLRSQHHRVKTAYCLQRRRVDTRTRLRLRDELR